MSSRNQIIERLRQQKRDNAPPGKWHKRQVFDDLAAQFLAALTAVHSNRHPLPRNLL